MEGFVTCTCGCLPCTCQVACADAVAFDYDTWIARYPQFQCTVSKQLAALFFSEAELFLANNCGSLVCDGGQRSLLLNMLAAHLAELNARATKAGVGGAMTGQVTNASEGSVSIGFSPLGSGGSGESPGADWFNQTPYGAAFWRATAQYRMARYYPGRQPYLGIGGWPVSIFNRLP